MPTLGLVFKGVDKGLKDVIGGIGKGIHSATDALGGFQGAMQVLHFEQLKNLNDKVAELGDSANEGAQSAQDMVKQQINFTRGLGAQYSSTADATNQLGAYNMMLRTLAQDTDLDVQAQRELAQQMDTLAPSMEKGADIVARYGKAAYATDMEMGDMVKLVSDLEGSWRFSNEQTEELMDNTFGMAKAYGLGKMAMAEQGKVMDIVNNAAGELGVNMDAKRIVKFSKSIHKSAGMLHKFSVSGEEAYESARKLAEGMLDNEDQLNRWMAGVGDMPEFVSQLAKVGVGLDETKAAMAGGPAEMAELFGEASKAVAKGTPEYYHLLDAMKGFGMDANQIFMATGGTMGKLAKGAEKAAGDINDVNKKIRSPEDVKEMADQNKALALSAFNWKATQEGADVYAKAQANVTESMTKTDSLFAKLNAKLAVFKQFGLAGMLKDFPLLTSGVELVSENMASLMLIAVGLNALFSIGTVIMGFYTAAQTAAATSGATLTIGQWLLNAAMTAFTLIPVVLIIVAIIAAIGLLVAAIVWVVKNWDTVKIKVIEVASMICEKMKWLGGVIGGFFMKIFAPIFEFKDKIMAIFEGDGSMLGKILEAFKAFGLLLLKMNPFSRLLMWIEKKFNIGDKIKEMFGNVANYVVGLFSGIKAALATMLPKVLTKFLGLGDMAEKYSGMDSMDAFKAGMTESIESNKQKIPHAETGGYVAETGLAVIHKGEEVKSATNLTAGDKAIISAINNLRGSNIVSIDKRGLGKFLRIQEANNLSMAGVN